MSSPLFNLFNLVLEVCWLIANALLNCVLLVVGFMLMGGLTFFFSFKVVIWKGYSAAVGPPGML